MAKYTVGSVANPKWANGENTAIDCDVSFLDNPNHSPEETVRFTAVASDPGWEHGEEIFQRALLGEFGPIEPYEPPPLTVEDYRAAIQAHVDAKASEKGYENGFSCATYATSSIPQWAAEAGAFIAWRDNVWAHAFSMLDDPPDPPPSPSGFISDPAFPVLVWP